MYKVWHIDKYKITFKLVISHWTDEIAFQYVYEYYSRNISTIKYLFMKIAWKSKMTNSKRTSRGPV
jgi:hypothetical protein